MRKERWKETRSERCSSPFDVTRTPTTRERCTSTRSTSNRILQKIFKPLLFSTYYSLEEIAEMAYRNRVVLEPPWRTRHVSTCSLCSGSSITTSTVFNRGVGSTRNTTPRTCPTCATSLTLTFSSTSANRSFRSNNSWLCYRLPAKNYCQSLSK